MKLVVVAPGGAVTGGPEAQHQLVSVANELEPGSAAILYQPSAVTPEPYLRYGCPVVGLGDVPEGALVVLPEIWPELSGLFPRNRCALWWLSVDNFGSHGQRDLSGVSLHLCQSEYAWRYVSWKVSGARRMLTDWVEVPQVEVVRGRRVVVNPAKDAGLLSMFVASNPGVEFGWLRGLDRVGVAGLLRSSDVYMDFGGHPGRDRPPREAALAGCVVLSTSLGAARLSGDMPLPARHKFDSVRSANAALVEVWSDWGAAFEAQASYREWVAGQRARFVGEVGELLGSLD